MDNNSNHLLAGRLIRNARIMNRETLTQVAKEIGVSASYLNHIEMARKIPTAKLIDKLVGRLGLSTLELTYLYNKLPEQVNEQLREHQEITNIIYNISELGLSRSEENEVYRGAIEHVVKYVADKFNKKIGV